MKLKKLVKKALIKIKLQINQVPILRKSIVSLLSISPAFYGRLQRLKPEEIENQENIEIKLSSQKARDVFYDIKKI